MVSAVHGLIRYYHPEDAFIRDNGMPGNWYQARHRLKYTLFEYELHLLSTRGHGKRPRIEWSQLSDSTIEHILPQTPGESSQWREKWGTEDMQECLHDIGNLVLTLDNSSYRNFEFARKRGPGPGKSYSDSDIRQERALARFPDWTRTEFEERRRELVAWINGRWRTEDTPDIAVPEVNDEADEDTVPPGT